MPTNCAVHGCGHNALREKGKFGFFRIPKVIKNQGEKTRELTEERRRIWISNIYRGDMTQINPDNTRVCSNHFITGKPSVLYDQTNPDWAPTQNMGHDRIPGKKVTLAKDRNERACNRAIKRKLEPVLRKQKNPRSRAQTETTTSGEQSAGESVCSYAQEPSASVDLETIPPLKVDSYTQTSIPPTMVNSTCQTDLTLTQLEGKELYVQTITCEIDELRRQLNSVSVSEEDFKDNPEKTRFYTGLPNFLLLMHVFNFIAPKVKATSTNALTQFEEFIMVLMRMKLNLPLQDLAYRFKVSPATVSRVFYRWIDVMSERLNFLIKWPDREELQKTMPMVFQKNFGKKVVVIIDCFEIFIDRPTSLIARAMTWSNYKHHNTVKFLIGVTPQGVISFISRAWGGRVSDKYLTEKCNILHKLLPGDVVLADRGFDIADSVGFYQARLHIPAFTRGKKQLSALEIEHTRKIANVRIHVERVIGLVRRKYIILQSILPIETVTVKAGDRLAPIDKIVQVCCALTNLSDSIVPFD